MTRPSSRRRRKKASSSIWAALGSKGGRARARSLSAKERRRIAMMGVQARLAKSKMRKLAKRIAGGERGAVRVRLATGKAKRKRRARARRTVK
jgi:hypothetical protein